MISLLHSGKFWLKLLVFGCTSLILLLAIDIAVLHYLFNAEKLQKQIDTFASKSDYKAEFDYDINRSLFPRPTVTIHNFRLANTKNNSKVAHVDSIKIGLGWQSLFGKPTIEKLQLSDAHINFIRSTQGKWNLIELWRNSDSVDHIQINRFIIDNAQIFVRDVKNKININNLNLQFTKLDDNSSLLNATGLFSGSRMQSLNYEIKGVYHPNAKMQWQDVKLNISATLPILGKSNSQWNFDACYLPDKQLLQTGTVQWQWQSLDSQLHLTGTGLNWQIGWNNLSLPQINGVATAQIGENISNTTISLNNSNWKDKHWSIEQFQIDTGWQNHSFQTALTLSGQLSWQDDHHWQIGNLSINSHQDSVNHLPNTRFISDLNGYMQGDSDGNADLNLQGQFDNQPINISLNNQREEKHNKLIGNINLIQLNLRPYMEGNKGLLPKNWQNLWQKWLNNRIIDCQFNINSFITPTVQLNQIKAHLTADAQTLSVNPLNIEMYGGSSTGMVQIMNSIPLSWKTSQHAVGLQMKSFLQDLFGFNNLDGQGDVYVDLHSSGPSFKQSLTNLSGEAKILMRQGIWNGIDINNILQHSDNQTTVSYNETNHTPFRLIRINLPISNALTQNSHLELHADNFDIKGNGKINWQQQQMDYNVLVATRRENKQNYLPLRINGTFTHPSFTIDYQRLTAGLHTSKQKQDSLRQTLQQQWLWLNQGAASSSDVHESAKKP